MPESTPPLKAIALTCSLKPSPHPSSAEKLAGEVLQALEHHGVQGESVRVVDHDIRRATPADRTPEQP